MSINVEEVEVFCRKNDEFRKSLEYLEWYFRDFNIWVFGVDEDEGEDCMIKIMDFIIFFGFDVILEIENVYCMGKKWNDKLRFIIIRFYSRFFKRSIL